MPFACVVFAGHSAVLEAWPHRRGTGGGFRDCRVFVDYCPYSGVDFVVARRVFVCVITDQRLFVSDRQGI